MPLGKYYCDYCDKQFQDTHFARKRHLQGIQYLRANDQCYKSQSSLSRKLWERGLQLLCQSGGVCQYCDSCKYFHIKSNVQNLNDQSFMDSNQSPVFQENQLIAGSSVVGDALRDRTRMTWENIPPSLLSPPEFAYPALPFVEWG